MSFARTVKKELVSIPVNRDEMLAELSAFLDMAVDIIIRDRKRWDLKQTTSNCSKIYQQSKRSIKQM